MQYFRLIVNEDVGCAYRSKDNYIVQAENIFEAFLKFQMLWEEETKDKVVSEYPPTRIEVIALKDRIIT